MESLGWGALLYLGGDRQDGASSAPLHIDNPRTVAKMIGIQSYLKADRVSTPESSHLRPGMAVLAFLEAGEMVQSRHMMAWMTILASEVELEGVGQIGVARLFQEIWRRGGADQVNAQDLWQSIIISLSLPGFRKPIPPADAAQSLQHLYQHPLRHWELSILAELASCNNPSIWDHMDLSVFLGEAQQTSPVPSTKGNDFANARCFDTLDPLLPAVESQNSRFPSDTTYDGARKSILALDKTVSQIEQGMSARGVAATQGPVVARSNVPAWKPLDKCDRRTRSGYDDVCHKPTSHTGAPAATIVKHLPGPSRQQGFPLITS